jgi:hypothetical protein
MTPNRAGKSGAAATELLERREASLRPRGRAIVSTPKQADAFLERVAIALRYGPSKSLPLASMFDATSGGASRGPFIRAAELTNHLLGAGTAIEVHAVAGRLTLVHRSLMPSLYTLVRRGRAVEDLRGIGANARRALALLDEEQEVTVGAVRALLGAARRERGDAGYDALAELSRLLLVDRGPFEINRTGIHYLSKEGYPYHLFHVAHADLVQSADRLDVETAADRFLDAYLSGACFCAVRTLQAMFKAFLSADEINASLARLTENGRAGVERVEGRASAVSARLSR